MTSYRLPTRNPPALLSVRQRARQGKNNRSERLCFRKAKLLLRARPVLADHLTATDKGSAAERLPRPPSAALHFTLQSHAICSEHLRSPLLHPRSIN